MTTAELKVSVINRITSLKDNYLLEQIQSLLEFEMTEKAYSLCNDISAD